MYNCPNSQCKNGKIVHEIRVEGIPAPSIEVCPVCDGGSIFKTGVCDKCDKITKDPGRGAYYRWRGADIRITGCADHTREILSILDLAQQQGANG